MSIEEIVIKHLQSEKFAYAVAEIIAIEYREKLFNEFGDQVAEAMHDHVKKLTEQFIADFEKESDIKRDIKRAFESMSKKELAELLLATPPIKGKDRL